MKILLFIRDKDDHFVHVSTATTDKGFDALMQYASAKVRNGYDVKLEHEQVRE